MGPQGPEHGLGGSPSGRRNPGYMWMSKGADLDDMSQLVPEPSLPKATKDYRTKDWPQSSFDHREEISEASLAEGFTFQRREPPRPGQFSNIPRHASLVMPAATQLCESFEHKVASPPKNKITVPLPRASPLDLPEICLPNKPAEIRSGIPEVSEESKPVCYNLKNVKNSSHPRGGSPKSADEANKSIRLLSPPKLTSSPTKSRYQESPPAADLKMAPPTHNSTYRLAQQPPHTKPMTRNEHHKSPPSTCGDLELPTYRAHPKSRHHRHKDSLVRPIHCNSTKDPKQLPRHRSSSVASSNISKKRSRVHKRFAKQFQAMTHFTECLNECLDITDDEVVEARLEIQRLRGDMQHQETELEKSRSLLDQKGAKLCETEKLYKALLEEDTRVLEDNKSLNSELELLRQQLSEEKKRSELLKEKHQESRSRLNDAIREQQDLFSRSRDLCQETMDQLRKDKAVKTSASDAVDKALETSQKKRAEMKRCLDEYRLQTEKDIHQKDQVITVLKERLSHQESLLAQEKLFADSLRAQGEEMGVARECVQTLDTLINGGTFVASNMLSREDLTVELGAVEKSIKESLSPVIFSLESAQKDSSSALTQLESSIRQNLDQFKDKALELVNRWGKDKEENGVQIQDLFKQIRELGGGLKKAETVCEHIGQKFDSLVESEQSHQRIADVLAQDLTQRFLDREVRLDDMECRLQQMHQGFATKIDTMISGVQNSEKEATKLVRSAATELQGVLEQGFGQENDRISRLLVETGNIAKTLAAHVDEHKQPVPQKNHKVYELQTTLELERESATQLTRKLHELEQKAQENEVLRDRWLKEIQSIEAVRAQLKTVQEQTSPVKVCEKKIDRLVEISRFIQSSTSYLATESEWVQQELVSRAPEPTIEADNNPSAPSTRSNGEAENQQPAKEDGAFRKVTVHSPDPGEGSPSPPPTVIQEQKRRREITQLRSILKGQVQSGIIESGSIESHSNTNQANQSKPPGLSNSSLNKTGSSSKQMVAEICSRMVRHDWSFPTVADFERDIQLASKKRERPQDTLMSSQLDNPRYRDPKKLRTSSYIDE
ncbi:hypothetical protein M441DRAFT_453702 [Trichoderma asperellum CBS 433.97]|uniref:Uncharacterized protein n=1 Tax=Trichoderma asperellum (strain ATCC 204424 / CBS 433.97 / NBRC 101777) TaxID=1042311 RepID=A0A2T3ZH44_TRIA4|nr:hypothetical protein M441DRAFT_453702 [Trichoderma asperellum CBS 433.97]PTB44121.1 hypothetical protein M441DRAFT_453702 [Trichoderma asperellum CBS 433.97]